MNAKQIFSDINTDIDNFLSNTNMNMVFNLKPDMNMNTYNYTDPDIFEIRISR
jgi:hypothetical protein